MFTWLLIIALGIAVIAGLLAYVLADIPNLGTPVIPSSIERGQDEP